MYVRLLLLLLAFWGAPTVAQAQWAHEPAGSTTRPDCQFPLSTCSGWYDGYSTPYATDTGDPASPPTVADFALPYVGPCPANVGVYQSCANGGGQFGYIHNTATREMFVGQWFKISAGYGCSAVGSSKVFFIRSFDNTFGGPRINGVFLISGCGSSKTWIFSHNTGDQTGYPALHNEHACPEDPFNGLTCRQNISSTSFQAGQWVKVEACVRASTSMTSRDGIVRLWINDVEVMRYNNLNYGQGVVNQYDATPTWDGYGNGQGFTTTIHQYFGHVHTSFPPSGGCASVGTGTAPNPDSPAGPPAAPTGVNATKVS